MTSVGELRCHLPSLEDLPAIAALDQRSLGGLWTEAGYRREMESPNSFFRVLSTLSPGQVEVPSKGLIIGIGCLWAIMDEAHITLLGVDPAYQGQGLGQWLLIHLLEEARQHHLKHATLEVRTSNTVAQNLYQKFGFQAVGRRPRYYTDGEDALLLWRSGLQSPEYPQELHQQRMVTQGRLQAQGWRIYSENISENISQNILRNVR